MRRHMPARRLRDEGEIARGSMGSIRRLFDADMVRRFVDEASVVALEDVSAVVVDRASLEHLMASSHLGQFVKALARRFLEMDQQAAPQAGL